MSHTKPPCNPPTEDMGNGNVASVEQLEPGRIYTATTSIPSLTPKLDSQTGTPILFACSSDPFNPYAKPATKLSQNEKTASEEQKERGTKYNQNKPRMSLIPARAEIEEAKVWTFGAKKYASYNWCKGIPFSEILDAIHRHYTAYKSGETIDPESGISHMAHIRCDAGMLIDFETTHPELDDRYKK